MPQITLKLACPVHRSFRVEQVAGMFDLELTKHNKLELVAEVPAIKEDWTIGAIVGPSGAGKSQIARKAFGSSLAPSHEWNPKRAVIDDFPKEISAKIITAAFTAVGFSSPPAWIKPFSVLSNGEQFRCNLARALLSPSPDGIVVIDEFTSVVDRTVGKVCSLAIASAIRAGHFPAVKKFVAVSCHYDILEWLLPDWTLDMASCSLARGRLHSGGSGWSGGEPPQLKLRIFRAKREAWRTFARHHYLSAQLAPNARCYIAVLDCEGHFRGELVGFAATINSLGRPRIRRVSRIVTLPDFQGIGLGKHFLNAIAAIETQGETKRRLTITTSHPAMIHALNKPDSAWRLTTFRARGTRHGFFRGEFRAGTAGRPQASFEFSPALPGATK